MPLVHTEMVILLRQLWFVVIMVLSPRRRSSGHSALVRPALVRFEKDFTKFACEPSSWSLRAPRLRPAYV